jgi:hypothetical protein
MPEKIPRSFYEPLKMTAKIVACIDIVRRHHISVGRCPVYAQETEASIHSKF